MENSPGFKLKRIDNKRGKLLSDYRKCIRCQKDKAETLQNGRIESVKKFVSAAVRRNDEVYQRIRVDITDDTLNADVS